MTPHWWLRSLALFTLGALASFSAPPVGAPWIALVSAVGLCIALLRSDSAWQTAMDCLAFSLGLHILGHGWVFTTLIDRTAAGPWVSTLGVVGFNLYLSAFFIVPGLAFRTYCHHSVRASFPQATLTPLRHIDVAVLAALLTAGEFSRSLFFNGFTSLSLGYSFLDWPLRGWLPVVGVYGCSFILYCTAGAIARMVWDSLLRPSAGAKGAGVVMGVFLLGLSSIWLDAVPWVVPSGSQVSFRLIQLATSRGDKYQPNKMDETEGSYVASITAAPASLILTPETAFASGLNRISAASFQQLTEFSRASGSHIVIGAPSISGEGRVSNSLFHFSPESRLYARYDKIQLMPFGEYAPVGFQLFTNRLDVPLSNMSSGEWSQRPFTMNNKGVGLQIGPLICSDEQTSAVARRWMPEANLLISASDMAWFDSALASSQMLRIARARAAEIGRPILRATNAGATAHIDHKGHVIAQLPFDEPGVLAGWTQPMSGSTPFSKFGGWSTMVLACLVTAAALVLDQIHRIQRAAERFRGARLG